MGKIPNDYKNIKQYKELSNLANKRAEKHGEKVDQDFIPEELAAQTDTPYYNDTFECTLKDDEYYVVGDNRAHGKSADSRYFGPIKKSSSRTQRF